MYCTRTAIRRAVRSRARCITRRRRSETSSSAASPRSRICWLTTAKSPAPWHAIVSSDGRYESSLELYCSQPAGSGRVFKETTNPDVATGDGIATAYRAGAVISDIEFVQFHPTALFVPRGPALSFDGSACAVKADVSSTRRVSRSCTDTTNAVSLRRATSCHGRSWLRCGVPTRMCISILRTWMPEFVRRRFPRVYETCLKHGVDITAGPVPVHPAAHYAMGGVRTDIDGRTSLPRLFAAGEAACSGVHGANRLASNSLLEGLVFGARAGAAMRDSATSSMQKGAIPERELHPDIEEVEVRPVAWECCGISRDAAGLRTAIQRLCSIAQHPVTRPTRDEYELRNIHTVALLIARCALAREESRGGHYRTDFPDTDPEFQKHSQISRDTDVTFA